MAQGNTFRLFGGARTVKKSVIFDTLLFVLPFPLLFESINIILHEVGTNKISIFLSSFVEDDQLLTLLFHFLRPESGQIIGMVFVRFYVFAKGEIGGSEGFASIVIGVFGGRNSRLEARIHGGLRRMILINNY